VDYNEHPVELNVSIEPGSQPFVKNLMIQNYLIAWAVCWWLVEIGCGWRMGVMGDDSSGLGMCHPSRQLVTYVATSAG